MTNLESIDAVRVLEFITPPVLFAATGIMLLAFIIVSSILVYHWNRYTFGQDAVKRVKRIYFTVSLVLFAMMGVSLLLMLP